MRSFKTIVICALIVLGLLLQWLQGQGSSSSQERISAEQGLLVYEDVEPFSRKPEGNIPDLNKKSHQALRVAQRMTGKLENTLAEESFEFSHAESETKPESEESEKSDESEEKDKDEEVEYDEDGNPIKKDKKDEKSEDENAEEESKIADEDSDKKKKPIEEKKEKEERGDSKTAESFDPRAGDFIPETDKPEDDEFVAYEEWARLILNQPNIEAVTRLVDHYQTNRVEEEVFYRLVHEMISDSRASMRRLGVMAAGLTPSRRSFVALAEVKKSEGYDSEVARAADGYLSHYSTMAYLPVLESILISVTSDSVYTLILATQKLDQAARTYMSEDQVQEPQGLPGQDGTVQLSSTQLKFERFIQVLENFIAVSPDAEAINVAQSTLTNLKRLLNS